MGEIEIRANWETASALVIVVLPIEIWLDLPEKGAYSFIAYDYKWNAAAARQRLESAAQSSAPPPPQQRQPVMRSGNIQPPTSSDTK